MAKPAKLNEKILKNNGRRAKKEIREAMREIHKLMRQSKRGTLDQRKLESGLKALNVHVGAIPIHWPYHFR